MNIQPPVSGFEPEAPTNEPAASSAGQSVADVSQIASTLRDEAPAVQEGAIAEFQRQQAVAGTKDAKGVTFDEAIHAKDAAGKPLKTAGGEWAKRRGRKAGAATASTPARSVVGGVGPQMGSAAQVARAAGENAANLLVTIARTFGGTEWEPVSLPDQGVDEMSNLRKSFADYFQAKNYKDIPPGVAMALAVVGYAGPRFFMPQTRTRLQKAKDWVAEKYLGWRRRKDK